MSNDLLAKIEELNNIGIALSAERDSKQLLEKILTGAKMLTNADGGTLYRVNNNNQLCFDVIQNDSLQIHLGGSQSEKIPFPPLPITLPNGEENLSAVATYVANKQETVNIKDIYTDSKFDFSGALKFDQSTQYRTKSMLAIPLVNFEEECLGILQLINAQDETGKITDFDAEAESIARSLASQASIALSNNKLIEEHKTLFESFSKLIADTIDKKSPYTGAHCKRVPVLTMLIANKAAEVKHGPFKNFTMNENELFELETAAWLHDCGKLTTPEYIMDKATKLETVYDKINLIESRLGLKAYEEVVEKNNIPIEEINKSKQKFQAIFERLSGINKGGEFLNEEDANYIQEVKNLCFKDLNDEKHTLLLEDEVENLNIQKGTLNDRERDIMQDHAAMSIYMLDMLPFPKELQRVCEYAGGHHERMDGKGYPNHLTREQLSLPARMMGVADIFEALSAGDRPYKDAKPLSESLKILGFLKKEGHIDPDTFNLFVEEKLYLDYAKEHLKPEQIDEVIHANIPGYEGS
jgi:HD-GYP domain-containing protein (c-di-GMP phosphodiesterase class II)